MMVQTGDTAEGSGSASAPMHRGWSAAKSKLVGYTGPSLEDACERGHVAAPERYRDTLDKALAALIREAIECTTKTSGAHIAPARTARVARRGATD